MYNLSLLKKISILVAAGTTLVLYTNMAQNIYDEASDEPAPLTAQEIANSINTTIDRIDNNEFGENGGKALAITLAKNINYLGTKINAKTCNELKNYVPKLPTGRYLLWQRSEGTVDLCQSSEKFIKSIFETLIGRQPSQGGMVKWLRLYQEQGFVDMVVEMAKHTGFSKKNPSPTEKVESLYRGFTGQEPPSADLTQWLDLMESQGQEGLIRQLAILEPAQIRNHSLYDGIIGYVDKVKTRGGKLEFKGWACQKRSLQPLKIEIYAGGTRTNTELIAETTANQDRYNPEAQCQTGGNHGFFVRANLSQKDLRRLSNQPIEVYGINPVTGLRFRVDANRGSNFRMPHQSDDDDD